MNLTLLNIAATIPTSPSRDEAMRQGMSLLMMLSLLGVLVVCMLAVIMVMRSTRRKRTKRAAVPTDMSVDAWSEASKRLDDSITEFDEEM